MIKSLHTLLVTIGICAIALQFAAVFAAAFISLYLGYALSAIAIPYLMFLYFYDLIYWYRRRKYLFTICTGILFPFATVFFTVMTLNESELQKIHKDPEINS